MYIVARRPEGVSDMDWAIAECFMEDREFIFLDSLQAASARFAYCCRVFLQQTGLPASIERANEKLSKILRSKSWEAN